MPTAPSARHMVLVVWPWTCGKEAAVGFALAALRCYLAAQSASPCHLQTPSLALQMPRQLATSCGSAVAHPHPAPFPDLRTACRCCTRLWGASTRTLCEHGNPTPGALWSRTLANLRLAGSVPPHLRCACPTHPAAAFVRRRSACATPRSATPSQHEWWR